jgi:hypothetical protein
MNPSCFSCSSTLPCWRRGLGSATRTPGLTEARNTHGYTRAPMRPAAALTVMSCLLVVAGCGGSD